MASRPNPRPSNSSKRRPGPFMPGSLILLITMVALLVGVFVISPSFSSRSITYTEFLKLVENKELKKIVFDGKNRLYGEVKDSQSPLAKELKLTGERFNVTLPPADDQGPL